jgi:hypothetical protein
MLIIVRMIKITKYGRFSDQKAEICRNFDMEILPKFRFFESKIPSNTGIFIKKVNPVTKFQNIDLKQA